MRVTTCMLAALALLSTTAFARKSYLIKLAHKDQIPQVRASTPEYTVFENNDDSFIIKYQGSMKAGWEWSQSMQENLSALPYIYHLTLDIVFTQSLEFSPVLSMPRLIYLEPVLTIDSFEIGYTFDVAKFCIYPSRNDLLCLSSYFKIAERNVLSTLVMRFQECYKTLLNCVHNLDNWRDEETAKYFEKCSQSSKTTITTYEKTFAEKNTVVMGNTSDTVLAAGTDCKPGTYTKIFPVGDI